MPEIQASLSDQDYQALLDLAQKRGLNPNVVLQQAIATEKLISDNVQPGDDLLIKRQNNTVSKVTFG